MKQGLFITFEGVDGIGKTTQLQLLHTSMLDANLPALTTREPGGVKSAEHIRTILLSERGLEPVTELLLHSAARAEHAHKLIKPHLEKGNIIISDRYVDSTIVYQGFAMGIPIATIMEVHQIGTAMLMPDITFVLQAPLMVSRSRQSNRNTTQDRYEEESSKFYEHLHHGFLQLTTLYPDLCMAIDATGSAPEIHAIIIESINKKFTLNLQAASQ